MPKNKGVNSRSLENLQPGGQPRYDQPKRARNVSTTDTAWMGLKELAYDREISLAELLERLGRGIIKLQDGEFEDSENIEQSQAA
ncbi:hypothetical protein AMR41_26305 [Hapalosiphon sp. MRB220]|nr:hypothetical protein AMR41_26305 [Hapalosiphon sp. MRB220]